jgi:hypothetical protein
VIVAAVVLGVLILNSGYHTPVVALPTAHNPVSGVTTTTQGAAPATTTTVSHAGVTVLVANDSTTNGVASGYATALQHAGWTILTPVTANPPIHATSSVYYAANKRSEADAVAKALGVPDGAVFPVSPATPVPSTTGADVIVLIGSDLAAETPPSTVPTTTATTAPKVTTTTKAHSSRAS